MYFISKIIINIFNEVVLMPNIIYISKFIRALNFKKGFNSNKIISFST
jgi:hypothetical protein